MGAIGNKNAVKHGLSNTRIHRIWHSMYCRCYYPKTNGYKNYGGRGIKVCEEWKHIEGFINFYNWSMNNGYNDFLTLDRIDVNGDYEPNNCKWSTKKEQSNNRRNNKVYEYKGIKKTQKQWCEDYGINVTTFSDRLKSGWSFEDALTKPINTGGIAKR